MSGDGTLTYYTGTPPNEPADAKHVSTTQPLPVTEAAKGYAAQTVSVSNDVTGPAASSNLLVLATPGAGDWEIEFTLTTYGTLTAAEDSNFYFSTNTAHNERVPHKSGGITTVRYPRVTLISTDNIRIVAGERTTPGASATYGGNLRATKLT